MLDGLKIRRLREAAGLTEKELGDRAGVSNHMISFIERELRSPSADKLKRIADTLGVTVDELYKDTA